MRSIIQAFKLPNRFIASAICSVSLTSLAFGSAAAGELSFTIKDIQQGSGSLYVALFNSAKSYNQNLPYRAQHVEANETHLNVHFSRLPKGEYAVRYFHDQNNNQKMDMNLFGMPLEGFGYSNNAKPNMGPAAYQQMKFEVPETGETQNQSQVIYP